MNKIIHQIYDKQPTGLYNRWSTSVKNHLPGWQYILWNDVSINVFVKKYFPTKLKLLDNYNYNIQRWDAVRYMILYQYGGIYVDMDVEFFRDVETLIDSPVTLFREYMDRAIYNEYYKYFPTEMPLITNSIFYTDAKHPFMSKLVNCLKIEQAKQKDYPHPGTQVMMSTGPGFMSKYFYVFKNKYNLTSKSNNHFESISKSDRRKILIQNKNESIDVDGMHWNIGSWITNNNSAFKIGINYE